MSYREITSAKLYAVAQMCGPMPLNEDTPAPGVRQRGQALNGLVPMTVGSWEYYDHEVSVEDYYVGHGQEAGMWVGSGAAALGLSGRSRRASSRRLFDEGRHPVSGAPLGLPYRHDSKRTVVTGFALSFSPPKSVSLARRFRRRRRRRRRCGRPMTALCGRR